MRIAMVVLTLVFFLNVACAQGPPGEISRFSAEKAMEHVKAQVAFGPRPPGSEALKKTREYLLRELESYGFKVEQDAFSADTPYGVKPMVNLIARKGPTGGSRDVIALASHYDGKLMEGNNFVAANDGGSSTGLLLELARVLHGRDSGADYWFVFLDGEEAFVQWSTFDSTYGSRHLARRWKQEGIVARVKALVLLDMIGDRNLDLIKDTNSTPWLIDLVWEAASKAGLRGILSPYQGGIEDDHLPFLDAGIPSVDIIDLDYGPNNSYHHTVQDTLDKVSVESLEKTGKLVLTFLPMLEQRLKNR
jgi:glutaminyl-peptide cyclotransferase